MLKEQIAVVELLKDIIKGTPGHLGKVPFTPQKKSFYAANDENVLRMQSGDSGEGRYFPRTTPEAQGIASDYLQAFIEELVKDTESDIHHLLMMRHGAVICECSMAPYQGQLWHATYSLCKSVTAMAIGMLIDEGKLALEDRINDLFKERTSILKKILQKPVSVRDLLTMTSGVDFNEIGAVTTDDWVKGFLEAPVKKTPGTVFDYNSMNTYMLSAIVTELTGQSLMDYLTPRLWKPLNIRRIFWEACPKGINKGGWGLFICPEDAAKLGQLYLNHGRWNGRQLVSAEWIKASTTRQEDTPDDMSHYGYGYQIWIGGRDGSFNFNGMLGQNVVVYPDIDMMLVFNAGSDELYQNCRLLNLADRYFAGDWKPEAALPANPGAQLKLQNLINRMGGAVPESTKITAGGWQKGKMRRNKIQQKADPAAFISGLHGKIYELEDKHVGVFPLMLQVIHNNYTDGIEKIGFRMIDRKPCIIFWEGQQEITLKLGFEKPAAEEIRIHEEPYMVGTECVLTSDEHDRTVLKLRIAFLEEAMRRKITIYFDADDIEVHFDETPGLDLIQDGLKTLLTDGTANMGLLDKFVDKTNIDFVGITIEKTIQPVVRGQLCAPDPQ